MSPDLLHPTRRLRAAVLPFILLALTLPLGGCAAVGQALGIEAPVFRLAEGRQSAVRLELPGLNAPRGAATVTLWTQVVNPNDFGFTLSTLSGDLHLENTPFADVDLPLGLPLAARGDTIIPLEIRVPIPDLDRLGSLGQALLSGGAVDYQLDGTVGVDAGRLGEPRFGPRTWLRGSLDVRTAIGGS